MFFGLEVDKLLVEICVKMMIDYVKIGEFYCYYNVLENMV